MRTFYDKEEYTFKDIEDLIINQVEESVYLDFKASGSLDKTDGKKKEISKDVASFANSDGGIIVYGLSEENFVASEISFIDGNLYTKEWLEQVINSSIQRPISDIIIHPIRKEGDVRYTIYVVKIPKSYNAPHLSKDNRYYKRHNFMSAPMVEYEVRDCYNRRDKTRLEIGELDVKHTNEMTDNIGNLISINFNLSFSIANVSKSIETQFKLEICLSTFMLDTLHPNPIRQYLNRTEDNTSIFVIPNSSPLFQEEKAVLANALVVFRTDSKELISQPIKVKLYYTNGVITKDFDLTDVYKFHGKRLLDCEWR